MLVGGMVKNIIWSGGTQTKMDLPEKVKGPENLTSQLHPIIRKSG